MCVRSLCNFPGIGKCTKRFCNNIILFKHSECIILLFTSIAGNLKRFSLPITDHSRPKYI